MYLEGLLETPEEICGSSLVNGNFNYCQLYARTILEKIEARNYPLKVVIVDMS